MFFKKKVQKVKALELTDTNFESIVTGTELPILIDFWAPWCGPCKVMGPIVDELAQEYDGKAIVAKINVDQNQKLSQHFQVRSIPTFMLIKENELKGRFQGMVPKPNLEELLNSLIDIGDEEE